MGYTHYWKCEKAFTPEQWASLQRAAKIIARRSKQAGAPLAGWNGIGRPVYGPDAIRLNGMAPDDFETFALACRPEGFNFCKTGHRPYDAAVVALLTVAARINPGFTWTSDGDAEDHADGIRMAAGL